MQMVSVALIFSASLARGCMCSSRLGLAGQSFGAESSLKFSNEGVLESLIKL